MVTKKTKVKDEDYGPDMHQFTCEVCKRKYFDTRRYFGEPKTKICLWCTKFPKTKERR